MNGDVVPPAPLSVQHALLGRGFQLRPSAPGQLVGYWFSGSRGRILLDDPQFLEIVDRAAFSALIVFLSCAHRHSLITDLSSLQPPQLPLVQ